MQDFMLIFHSSPSTDYRPSPEEIQASIKRWQDWIGNIAAQGKFLSTNALNRSGKVVAADGTVTDGPYTELKEIIGGYVLIRADNYDEAVDLSAGCPTFRLGGKVEVREVMKLD
ncbi:MAG: YciI family protein [Bacteroidota bacterium]